MSSLFFLMGRALAKVETHPFPFFHMPDSLTEALLAVQGGTMEIHRPLDSPSGLQGRLGYSPSRCTGCGACVELCPCEAIAAQGEGVEIDLGRCCLCLQCVEICPVSALFATDEFLFSTTERQNLRPSAEELRADDEDDLLGLTGGEGS